MKTADSVQQTPDEYHPRALRPGLTAHGIYHCVECGEFGKKFFEHDGAYCKSCKMPLDNLLAFV